MAVPTARALKRKPKAIVILSWDDDKADIGTVTREFEWYNAGDSGQAALDEYFDYLVELITADTEYPDVQTVLVEVTDTKSEPMTLGKIVAVPDNAETKVRLASVDHDLIVQPEAAPEKKVTLNKKAVAAKKTVKKTAATPAKKTVAKKAVAKRATVAPSAPPPTPKKRVVRKSTAS